MIIENSKSNHLGAQGTINPRLFDASYGYLLISRSIKKIITCGSLVSVVVCGQLLIHPA